MTSTGWGWLCDSFLIPDICSESSQNPQKCRHLKMFPAKALLECVCMDILRELMSTARGYRYLLVITDCLTKPVCTIPLRVVIAAEAAKQFVNHFVFSFGPPLDLVTENGSWFASRFFQDVCKILNVHNLFTIIYHTQSNCQVERFIPTILSTLHAYI